MAGCCEHYNEPSCFIECGKIRFQAGPRLAARVGLCGVAVWGECRLDTDDATACVFVWLSSPSVCVHALSVPRVVVDICTEEVVLGLQLF